MLRSLSIAILALLLSITLSAGLMAFAIDGLLMPVTYTDALSEHDAYSALEQRLPADLPLQENPRSLIDELILGFLSYINGDADELELALTIDPSELLDELSKREGCEENESAGCIPAGLNESELAALLQENGFPVNASEPIRIDLADELELAGPASQARLYVGHFRVAQRVLAALAIVLAALIVFIARPIKAGVRAVDAELIIVGSSAAIAGLLLQQRIIEMMPGQYGVLEDVLVSVLGGVLHAMVVYGGIALSIGFITLIATCIRIERN